MDFEKKLSSLKRNLNEILSNYQSRCLWWSGGADSQLILEILLETKIEFGILRFDNGWTRKQRQLSDNFIIKNNLQVFSYPPQSFVLIGKAEQISLVSGYLIDNQHWIPNVRDLVDGENCGIDLQLETAKLSYPPIEFDLHIWGSRFEDKHWAFDDLITESSWEVGKKRIICPLADWTREEVLKGLKTYRYDYSEPLEEEDTGNLICCHNCLKEQGLVFCPKENKTIPTVNWNKEQNLENFRATLK